MVGTTAQVLSGIDQTESAGSGNGKRGTALGGEPSGGRRLVVSLRIDLSGRSFLVTGGSRGIGAATARLLANAGARVAITYQRRKDQAEAVVAEIQDAGKGKRENGNVDRGARSA